ncbi:hypothetical protein ILUMI_14628, partial [Ignelater luminosus]
MMQPVDSLCGTILENHKKRCRGSNRKTRTTGEERMEKRQQLENLIGKLHELHDAREAKKFYKGIKQLKRYHPRETMIKNPGNEIL